MPAAIILRWPNENKSFKKVELKNEASLITLAVST
jgi:hypothetical protein